MICVGQIEVGHLLKVRIVNDVLGGARTLNHTLQSSSQ